MNSTSPPGRPDPAAPLVSIIIPTKDASETLQVTLDSIEEQSYRSIETVVVDNASSDRSIVIAQQYGCRVLSGHFTERSAQLNAALDVVHGTYSYIVGADFVLQHDLVAEAVQACETKRLDAVVIHNTSDPNLGLWARVRKLERDTYRDDWLNIAARFIRTDVLRRLGGLDERLVAAEDYDLHRRLLAAGGRIARISGVETHVGEPRRLREVWDKHFYYGRTLRPYIRKHGAFAVRQLSPVRPAFLRHWRELVGQPDLALAFLVYQGVKYLAGLAGFIAGSRAVER